jgi:hypothetical protein
MSDIDAWITAHGLEAAVDNLIRTCGLDLVQAALDGAPDRFASRGERLLGFSPPPRPGAPRRHGRRFYEALFEAVSEIKRRYSLDDKTACHRLANAIGKVGDDDVLAKLHLDQVAGLEGGTLYREFKRAKTIFAPPRKLKPAKEQADLRGPPRGQK